VPGATAFTYVLKFENSRNILESKRMAIAQWEKVSIEFVGKSEPLVKLAHDVEQTGIKPFDALHIACAITAHCDYLITVDKRMTKYHDGRIVICNPVDFIYVLKSQPFDYTEWRKTNLCPGMTVDEISDAADTYCRENS
jgi:predicted nucleic acid-binding protein